MYILIDNLRQWLYEPRVRNVDIDSDELLAIHTDILRGKPLLNSAFNTFYTDIIRLSDALLTADGQEIELGTGSGFFNTIRSELTTSDVKKSPNIDIQLDAQNMDLEANSIRAIYAINVFHHLQNPQKFFSELTRVLKPGGGCILIEPHAGFFSSLVHKNLHSDEHFDKDAKGWKTSGITGPLSGANQALAHIIFERDLDVFENIYGKELEVIHKGYELNAFRYIFSGGLNFRQLLPTFMNKPLAFIEWLLSPIAKYWSLHQIIVIRKI
jgi:SAM-dependent methyltransferase